MNLDQELKKSIDLLEWIDEKKAELNIELSKEGRKFSVPAFNIVLEHHRSINLLISNRLFGSAFALVRPVFETYIRAMWLGYCATNDELKCFEKGKVDRLNNLIEKVEKLPEFKGESFLTKIKEKGWFAMNAYTHSGFHQLCRQYNGATIAPNYENGEIFEVLNLLNSISKLSAYQLFDMGERNDFSEELSTKNQ